MLSDCIKEWANLRDIAQILGTDLGDSGQSIGTEGKSKWQWANLTDGSKRIVLVVLGKL